MRLIALAAVAVVAFAASASAADLTVINNSSVTITGLKVAQASSDDWSAEDDILKGAKIAAHSTGTVTGIDAGKWDLQVTDADGQSCEVLGVSFSGDDMKWTIGEGDLEKCEENQ